MRIARKSLSKLNNLIGLCHQNKSREFRWHKGSILTINCCLEEVRGRVGSVQSKHSESRLRGASAEPLLSVTTILLIKSEFISTILKLCSVMCNKS
jgi:hypothetical protein